MAKPRTRIIPNQVFVGLPWKNVRPKYDRIVRDLEKKYPLYFTIVGRDDGQDAKDLFDLIKRRIESSSYAIFDATGGNSNVSLEYGYAEGIDVPRIIYLSARKSPNVASSSGPIISDLGGKLRVQYKTKHALSAALHRFCKSHKYTCRFEKALFTVLKGKSKGSKKSGRALALKIIHALDGGDRLRRSDLVQRLEDQGYKAQQVEDLLKKLHTNGVITCSVGKYSDTRIS